MLRHEGTVVQDHKGSDHVGPAGQWSLDFILREMRGHWSLIDDVKPLMIAVHIYQVPRLHHRSGGVVMGLGVQVTVTLLDAGRAGEALACGRARRSRAGVCPHNILPQVPNPHRPLLWELTMRDSDLGI